MIESVLQHARPAYLDPKSHIIFYRHIFVYLWDKMENGRTYPAAISLLFTKLKFDCMPKKTAEPRKNKPTKKRRSAQKKANPKKKAR